MWAGPVPGPRYLGRSTMIEGRPSATAQRVAAYRLEFDRLAAAYGDPSADDRLARDVAGPPGSAGSESMARYLRARTAFFDRVVVNAIDRGVNQLVSVGAGYDGRALRYAAPGVRWFEVDHPATSADKQARLARLGLSSAGLTFVVADLHDPGLGRALTDAGLDPEAPTQYLCEGVAVYLGLDTVRSMLRELRSVAGPGTRLALSISAGGATDEGRQRFQGVVSGLGEPARTEAVTPDQAGALFDAGGWSAVALTEPSRRAGLVVLRPNWAVATAPATAGRLGRFMEAMLHRNGSATLAAHLEQRHRIKVRSVKELDLGVFRVGHDGGPDWIARLGPPGRAPEAVESDAALLDTLRRHRFPAEQPARADPASTHHGQGVLVTELAPGRRGKAGATTSALLGDLLGRLHAIAGPGTDRPGGAWHHLVPDGSLSDELDTARHLWAAARGRVGPDQIEKYESFSRELAGADDLATLPHALVHADLVANNVIAGPDGRLTVIDWGGAGQGARLAAFGCLLWGAGSRGAPAAMAAYRRHVTLTPAEWEALEQAFLRRPLILAGWSFCTGRQSLDQVTSYYAAHRKRAGAVVNACRAAASG